IENLLRVVNGLRQRKRSTERFTLDKLHHQIVWSHIIKRTDVRMIQRSDGQGFAREALFKDGGMISRIWREDLDGNFPVEAQIRCAIHLSHATGSYQRLDAVVS